MDRRRFLLTLAAGLAVAATGRGAVTGTRAGQDVPLAAPTTTSPAAAVADVPRTLLPPTGVVTELPGAGNGLALTIDDGTSSEVVAAFAAFAKDADVRLTLFPNGCYRSWEENAAVLRPLVDSGQVALGNHTWSHPDITTLGDAEAAEEIARNRDFITDTFGVDTPFFRPPFGSHDERTDRIAADLGHPTIAMWNGTLGDSRVLTGAELVGYAREWFLPQAIVVGHANQRTVTTVYGELLELIQERRLRTVTMADVWAAPRPPFQGVSASGSVGG
ncbi:polysaccharide deacetylase family protein [Blastococcus sp. TF02-09]|uniref:polysaccharide deacetylase family protein n=1 Tax=Blastococcus sp. TF02-09 TaxID=2250576 RepID=UPI000DEAF8F6|nr:polysaccharide deacetylase family protein [Blastococcus sp. TF02-9]RBY75636.1 polysaccharide deacetylase family protein [Blastococcus sp. TF02-9]